MAPTSATLGNSGLARQRRNTSTRGIVMIIFGTRGVTTTPQRGEFHCPTCNTTRNYGLKRVRRFFTLYFIPLIPLDKLGEYVECISCKDAYKPSVLEHDPAANRERFEAEYQTTIRKVMMHMLLADGVVEDAEIDMAQQVYQKVSGQEISQSALREEIYLIRERQEPLADCLAAVRGHLNDEGKEMVIKAALYVALADGEFQQEEQNMLAEIGAALGMTHAHVQGVISSAG